MKGIIKLPFLFLLFSSSSFSMSDSSYFPLQIGNNWEYSSTFSTTGESVVDTLRIRGNLFYGFFVDDLHWTYWLRESNERVYILDTNDSSEFVLLNFKADIEESWQLPVLSGCFWGDKITLISRTDTVITPIDTFYNCYKFLHEVQCLDAGIWVSYYARGIGKVGYKAIYIWGMADFNLKNYHLVTGIFYDDESTKNFTFSLFPNYPNPFNSSTVIGYSIPQNDYVNLSIYNLLGQKVLTVVNQFQHEGNYQYIINTQNLSSGFYIYNLSSGRYSQSRKMLLVK